MVAKVEKSYEITIWLNPKWFIQWVFSRESPIWKTLNDYSLRENVKPQANGGRKIQLFIIKMDI